MLCWPTDLSEPGKARSFITSPAAWSGFAVGPKARNVVPKGVKASLPAKPNGLKHTYAVRQRSGPQCANFGTKSDLDFRPRERKRLLWFQGCHGQQDLEQGRYEKHFTGGSIVSQMLHGLFAFLRRKMATWPRGSV